jgi:hypothetical protein
MPSFYSRSYPTGDGATATFAVPFAYLDKADVNVSVAGVPTAILAWPSASQVTLASPPASGAIVEIKRTTPRSSVVVSWPTPSTFKASDLNKLAKQVFYLCQESLDSATFSLSYSPFDGNFDAGGRRVRGVGDPLVGTDAPNKSYVDTVVSGAVFGSPLPPVANPTFTGTLSSSTSGLVIGYNHSQVLSGTQAAGFNANLSNITADTVDLTDPSSFVNQHTFQGVFGGAGVRGGRQGVYALLTQVAPTSAANGNRNYVASAAHVDTAVGDGGTNLTTDARGGYFALNPIALLLTGAVNCYEVTGGEVNIAVQTGASVKHKFGWTIVGHAMDRVHGDHSDAMLGLSNQAGAVGWNDGILIGDANGTFPIVPAGSIVRTIGGTLQNAIDLSNTTITQAIIRGSKSILTESSLVLGDALGVATISINGASADAKLVLTSKGAEAVAIQARSGLIADFSATGNNPDNYFRFIGQPGAGPFISMAGALADIDFTVRTKGAGTLDVNFPSGSTVGAAGAASAMPTPVGYATIKINGTARKIAYFNV